MAFFQSAVGTLQTLVVALGAGLEILSLTRSTFPLFVGYYKG